ncbi:MAG: enoyl-CoA hydratase-related protein [Aliidongia sp.]
MSVHADARVLLRYEAGAPDQRVAHVAIDNPAKLNTLTPALLRELAATIWRLAGDDSLRAVVLGSTGEKAFIGGADIDVMAALRRGPPPASST